jgi:REP element-mobilizing transposase RayT
MTESNLNYKEHYQRNLPHFQPQNAMFAITFRLAFSLPIEIIQELEKEKKDYEQTIKKLKNKELEMYKTDFKRRYFEHFDSLIAQYDNMIRWLEKPEISKIVSHSLHYWDKKRYHLFAFCIMPNHVHLLIEPIKKDEAHFYSIAEILFSIKRYTAGECNKILNRKRQFWQHEHYDHAIRDDKDFQYQVAYMLENPVKAKLVDNWKEWEFSYLRKEYYEYM